MVQRATNWIICSQRMHEPSDEVYGVRYKPDLSLISDYNISV